jgi:hypothetical protein
MKKFFFLGLASSLLLASCQKDNENVRTELENALPTIALTSLGLKQQVGPFNQSDVIQVTFGGSITKAEPATIDFAWYTAPTSGAPALVDSVRFNSWTETAATANGNNSVATTFVATSYPNTQSFSSNMNMRLAKLTGGSRSYTLRVYARTKGNEVGTVSVTRLVTIK